MSPPVFLQGRALVSALGPTLDAAMASLRRGGVAPRPLDVAPGAQWPYFAIDDDGQSPADWYARARERVRQAIIEAGADQHRTAPLFVASSSLNVGALESGAPFLPDCQTFVEQLAAWLDWEGPVVWVSTACTSSMVALLDACQVVRDAQATHAVVLGLELFNRFSGAGFGAMQLLDTQAARPLAADRAGLVLGEALSVLVLGREPTRWRLCGGANRIDGSNPAGAHREAVATMIRAALNDSKLDAGAIDLIKLQAAGSPHNDAEEMAGVRAVFDTLPALTTLKTAIGHTLGASGAAEIALLTACIEHGLWPAPPDGRPDPAIGAALSAHPPRARPRARHILAHILGFGGGHVAVVLEDRAASA